MEAIELAITGEIQREEMGYLVTDIDYKNKGNVKLYFDNGDIIEGIPLPKERKERESKYYQNRERKFDKLNQAFHRYNYFSTEDTYNFCFGEEGQPDYSDEFGRIVFGEELKIIEKNWSGYKSKFGDLEVNYNDKLTSLNQEIENVKSLIYDSNEQDFTLDTIKKLLRLAVIENTLTDEFDFEKLKKWASGLYTQLIHIDAVSEYFDAIQESGIFTKNDLITKQENVKAQLKQLNTNAENISQQIEVLEVSIKFKNDELNNKKVELDKKNKRLNVLNDLSSKLQQYYSILSDPIKENTRLILDKEIKYLQNEINLLKHYKEQWENTLTKDFTVESYTMLLKNKKDIDEKIYNFQFKYEEINNQIKLHENKQRELDSIVSKIKSLGKSYLVEKPNTADCPLCGAKYSKPEELAQLIMRELSNDSSQLELLYSQERELNNSISKQKENQQQLIEKISVSRQLIEIVKVLIREEFITEVDTENESLDKLKKLLGLTLGNISIKELNLNNSKAKARNLEEEGFSLDLIFEVEEFRKSKVYCNLDQQHKTADQKIKVVQNEINKTIISVENLKKEIEEIEIGISKYSFDRKELTVLSNEIQQKLESLDVSLKDFEETLNIFENILGLGVSLKLDTSLVQWRSYLKKAVQETDKLLIFVNKKIEVDRQANILKQLENEFNQNKAYKDKCSKALEVLNELKQLSHYNQDFLAENIGEISDRFISLHSPKEFDKLGLKDGKVIAYRRGTKKFIPIHQMSAGQRTAVVLSVFFTMNLRMPTAPKFLLLDEPIANMDDLNIVGLLDFLRELTISKGVQIFFTTANPTVAALFKRKFSFAKSGFYSFDFIRLGEERVRIARYKINPDTNKMFKDKEIAG